MSTPSLVNVTTRDKIARYMAQLAPHIKERQAAQLLREAMADLDRMRGRIESLRGLCKYASGKLFDAGDMKGADEILELVGDMERKPSNAPAQGCERSEHPAGAEG